MVRNADRSTEGEFLLRHPRRRKSRRLFRRCKKYTAIFKPSVSVERKPGRLREGMRKEEEVDWRMKNSGIELGRRNLGRFLEVSEREH